MKLYNNTPNQVFWDVNYGNSAGCGSIKADETLDHPQWDHQKNVQVSFYHLEKTPGEPGPFEITIPKSGKGMAVTIGIFQQ
jgi:hypothetical protein